MTTEHADEGYLRKNGVPYSENAVITEYIDRLGPEPDGAVYLLIRMHDRRPEVPAPAVRHEHPLQARAGRAAKWNPTPCKTDPPALAK